MTWSPHRSVSENVPLTTGCAMPAAAAHWLGVQEKEALAWYALTFNDLRVLQNPGETYVSLGRLKHVK